MTDGASVRRCGTRSVWQCRVAATIARMLRRVRRFLGCRDALTREPSKCSRHADDASDSTVAAQRDATCAQHQDVRRDRFAVALRAECAIGTQSTHRKHTTMRQSGQRVFSGNWKTVS